MFHLGDYLIYCFVTAYTPGANNLLSMSNAMRLGLRRSLRFNLGILTGFAVVMTVCTIFCAAMYQIIPKAQTILRILGAVYLLYLAWKIWKSTDDPGTGNGKEAGFFSGLLLQFVNPKIYIYAITAMSLYILPVYQSARALIAFIAALSLIGASGSLLWALFGSAFHRFFSAHAKGINLVMALLLVYCAAALFL